MRYFSERDISDLKSNITEIIIDSSLEGQGFTVTLGMKDGRQQTFPGSMGLAEALGYSVESSEI